VCVSVSVCVSVCEEAIIIFMRIGTTKISYSSLPS